MDHRRQESRVTSPVQAPSVTCDLAAINVEDLRGGLGEIAPVFVSEGGLEPPSPRRAIGEVPGHSRAREGGRGSRLPQKSGKSQGRYPTLPVQSGHNTHD